MPSVPSRFWDARAPRQAGSPPSSILLVPKTPVSPNAPRPQIQPGPPHGGGLPGVPWDLAACPQLLAHSRSRIWGTEEGEATSEGPCRCPQVPVSGHAAGRGAGVKHCPDPGCLLSTRPVFPAAGLDLCRKRPATAWAGCRGVLSGDSHVWPRQPNSSSFRVPRRWDVGAQETRGEKERQVPHDFGGPPGFAPTSWAQATGSSRIQPDTHPSGFEDFAHLTRTPGVTRAARTPQIPSRLPRHPHRLQTIAPL